MSNPNRDELGRFAEGDSINIGMKVSTNAGIGKVVGFGSDQGEQTIDVDVAGEITSNFRHNLRKLPSPAVRSAAKAIKVAAWPAQGQYGEAGTPSPKRAAAMAKINAESRATSTSAAASQFNKTIMDRKRPKKDPAEVQRILADFKKKMGI